MKVTPFFGGIFTNPRAGPCAGDARAAGASYAAAPRAVQDNNR
jgi:hypothetical protein